MNDELTNQQTKNKIERVIIDQDTKQVIKNIMNQIEQELGDAVSITPKILINFLLRKRSQKLNPEELSELKNENFDLIKAMKKATDEVIKAKLNGRHIELNDIVKLIQTPSVIQNATTPNKRCRKKKENRLQATQQSLDASNNSNNVNSTVKNNDDKNQITDSKSLENQNNLHPKSS